MYPLETLSVKQSINFQGLNKAVTIVTSANAPDIVSFGATVNPYSVCYVIK